MHLTIFWGDFKLLLWQITSVFLWEAFCTALGIQNILCYSTVHMRAAFIDFSLLLKSSPIYNPPHINCNAYSLCSQLPAGWNRMYLAWGQMLLHKEGATRDVQDYALITTVEAGPVALHTSLSIWTWISNMQQLHLRLAGWVSIYTHDCKHGDSQTPKCRWYLYGGGTASQNADSV